MYKGDLPEQVKINTPFPEGETVLLYASYFTYRDSSILVADEETVIPLENGRKKATMYVDTGGCTPSPSRELKYEAAIVGYTILFALIKYFPYIFCGQF